MANLFDRLDARRTTTSAEEKPQPQNAPAQLLLNWISRRAGNQITWREIRNHGPRPIRDREIAINAAKVLTAHGWLAPINSYTWQIIRQPITPQK